MDFFYRKSIQDIILKSTAMSERGAEDVVPAGQVGQDRQEEEQAVGDHTADGAVDEHMVLFNAQMQAMMSMEASYKRSVRETQIKAKLQGVKSMAGKRTVSLC